VKQNRSAGFDSLLRALDYGKQTVKWTFIIFLFAMSGTTVYAGDTPASFSSAYTHLSKDCKWAYSQAELGEGQDNALVCKGYGKYQLYIYFSASDTLLTVQLKKDPDTAVFSEAVKGINEKDGVVEWRMFNKVPFAIIVRAREYSIPEEGRKTVKESLVVRGLGDYAGIEGSVDVKENSSPNEKARSLADDGYSRKARPTNR